MKKSIKKSVSVVVAIALVAVAAVSGYAYYNTPVAYMSLDINPSLEVAVNALNRVIGVEAANEEGNRIMQGLNLRNLGVEQAINALVQHAQEEGFVEEDGSTVIAINAQAKSRKVAEKLSAQASEGIQRAMKAKNAYSAVYASSSDISLREEAKEMGVSAGKYRMIKALQMLDPELSEEDYKDETVGTIVGLLHERINENDEYESLGEVMRTIADEVKEVAKETAKNKTEAAERNRENENNQNANRNDEDEESENRNQEQEREKNQNSENNKPISDEPESDEPESDEPESDEPEDTESEAVESEAAESGNQNQFSGSGSGAQSQPISTPEQAPHSGAFSVPAGPSQHSQGGQQSSGR